MCELREAGFVVDSLVAASLAGWARGEGIESPYAAR